MLSKKTAQEVWMLEVAITVDSEVVKKILNQVYARLVLTHQLHLMQA